METGIRLPHRNTDSHVQNMHVHVSTQNINILFTEINNKQYFIFPTKTDAAAVAKRTQLHAAEVTALFLN